MKNIITLLFLSFSSLIYSQSLENTKWDVYFFGEEESDLGVEFGVDTFYLVDPEPFAFSIYTENMDTFRIKDLSENGCIGDVWGTYLFNIENDTLSFELIEDECDTRSSTLVESTIVKTGTNSNININILNDVSLFPNPITNEILNIKSQEKIDQISIYDSYGKLLISTSNTTSFDLSRYNVNLFFVELRKGNNRLVKKVVRF